MEARHRQSEGGVNSAEAERLKHLWGQVILRAITDAGSVDCCHVVERDQARSWLTNPSRDLQMTCDFAGIAYEPLLKSMQAVAKCSWRRESLARFQFAEPGKKTTTGAGRGRPGIERRKAA